MGLRRRVTRILILLVVMIGVVAPPVIALDAAGLATLPNGRTAAENALWIENPVSEQFRSTKRVVVAEVEGPAVITMLHFALPQERFANPEDPGLGRELLLQIYWDGQEKPSVNCPLVDFFCDSAGRRDLVDTGLVTKKRGFNAYFPMPFRKSARVDLVYDGPMEPGDELWKKMPCYAYVMYRKVDEIGDSQGYFHASWHQEALLLGKRDYTALETEGRGKFVGWNVTVRRPGAGGYPVDENAKFYIDGEQEPSVVFQGLEDGFGFSWGFPGETVMFSRTGYFPFFKGAATYRFFVTDAITFEKSLRVRIGFGENEHPMFRRQFSKVGNELQLSSTAYWYQSRPRAAASVPSAKERAPAPEDRFWLHEEQVPSAEKLRRRGVKLRMHCGRPGKEVVFSESGYGAKVESGFAYTGWPWPVYHCRAGDKEVRIALRVPKGSTGTVRAYAVDPDNFQGGRRQKLVVEEETVETLADFQDGRWVEAPVDAEDTEDGRVQVCAVNLREEANAVISIIEWVNG